MSTQIEIADRIEINELLGHYCHSVDHGDSNGWAALFTPDGVFEVAGIMRFQGADQLRAMPGIVTEQGAGKWRHQITNVTCEPGGADEALIKAYGLVTDWRDGGKLVTFSDYEIKLNRIDGKWRIATLLARAA